MSLQDRLTTYLRKELEYVPAATSFNLRVVDATTMQSELVQKFAPPAKVSNPHETADELYREIYARAKDVAKSMSHIARFMLTATVKKKGDAPLKRSQFPFTLRGEMFEPQIGEHGTIVESEAATPSGLQAQLMRHLEAKERVAMEKDTATFEALLRENHRLSKSVEDFQERFEESRKARELLLDKSQERKIVLARAEAEERRKDELVQLLKREALPHLGKYLPGLLDRISTALGAAPPQPAMAAPAGAIPASDLDGIKTELKDIFGALPQEEQEKLLNQVGPERAEKLLKLLGVL